MAGMSGAGRSRNPEEVDDLVTVLDPQGRYDEPIILLEPVHPGSVG
jgi:hypothetical protein